MNWKVGVIVSDTRYYEALLNSNARLKDFFSFSSILMCHELYLGGEKEMLPIEVWYTINFRLTCNSGILKFG